MKATRGNKVYTITEDQQKFYTDAGYDVVNDDGEVVAYGRGKTVPYADYAAVKEENAKLRREMERLKEVPPENQEEKEPSEEGSKKTPAKKSGGKE